MSSTVRVKTGLLPARTIRYKSPGAPPWTPAFPFPARRMRWPSRVPGLMRNSAVSVRATVPWPLQVCTCLLHLSSTAAAWALDIEFHPSAHLCHLAGAVAFRANHFAALGSRAMTGRARHLTSDLQLQRAAANRRPEIDIHLIFEIATGLRTGFLLVTVEHAGKNISKSSPRS